jgi:radical SAM superfamily enzyme YgiQ (UPF0313 family)
MFFNSIKYNEPVFRPPAEANSLIIQATLGCSWNKCAFCEMYSTKAFKIRKIEDIQEDILKIARLKNDYKKIFLADGNAFILNSEKLMNIIRIIKENLPKIRRISAYSLPKDIENKSIDELIELKQNGLDLLYVGIETGDNELLKLINKSETYNSTIDGLLKARKAGIKLSVMILNGLGGKKYLKQHALNSAKIINEIQPEFLSTLVLSYPFGEEFFKKKFSNDFHLLDKQELLQELKIFIENLNLSSTIFRSDHASNYLPLKGIFPKDKEKLINEINFAIQSPETGIFREEWERGL